MLHSQTEEEMDTIPLEVWTAFEAIAAGALLILVGSSIGGENNQLLLRPRALSVTDERHEPLSG
jgi:hypothetical protein